MNTIKLHKNPSYTNVYVCECFLLNYSKVMDQLLD